MVLMCFIRLLKISWMRWPSRTFRLSFESGWNTFLESFKTRENIILNNWFKNAIYLIVISEMGYAQNFLKLLHMKDSWTNSIEERQLSSLCEEGRLFEWKLISGSDSDSCKYFHFTISALKSPYFTFRAIVMNIPNVILESGHPMIDNCFTKWLRHLTTITKKFKILHFLNNLKSEMSHSPIKPFQEWHFTFILRGYDWQQSLSG
jgi:hypothetical protein